MTGTAFVLIDIVRAKNVYKNYLLVLYDLHQEVQMSVSLTDNTFWQKNKKVVTDNDNFSFF